MAPWIEAVTVLVLTLFIALLAYGFGRRTNRSAVLMCAISILLLGFILTLHVLHVQKIYAGMDWIACSRFKFVLLGLTITIGLCGPLGRLTKSWKRTLTLILTAGYLTVYLGLPFFVPALMQKQIRSIPTLITNRGVCLQSTSYTCGPAAAVTALKHFGIMRSEGQIASASRTAPIIGTCPWQLYKALEKLCRDDGIQCQYLSVNSLSDLPSNAITLAILKEGFLIDHCVAILGVTDTSVIYADPAVGLRSISRESFEAQWRQTAITLQPEPNIFAAK